jgi:hypothetical protein
MAIIKNINSSFGVDAVYWKIAELTADFVEGTANVLLFGYASQESRFAGFDPLIKTGLKISVDNYFDRSSLYDLVKNLPEFKSSTDA